MFPHFLVAIADLAHPLSNNRSSVRIIGCLVEEHEHVRDTTHPPKHYGCIYVTRSLYEVTFPMSYRNVGSSCPPYRERRWSPHRTDSDALYAVGGGNTGPASSVTTNFTPYYLDKKHRREGTPVFGRRV